MLECWLWRWAVGEAGKQDDVGVQFLFLCNTYVEKKVAKSRSMRGVMGKSLKQCLATEVWADARHAAAAQACNPL